MKDNLPMPNSLKPFVNIWSTWEIRVLVVSSLLLQIFLLSTAGSRKRTVSVWRGLFLWIAYLLADYVATFALGYLSQSADTNDKGGPADQKHHLQVFWAPFLLLHLGGQDTITALSIEDNELWKRHLLTLISQVILAIYVFVKSWSRRLLAPAIFMFAAGCLKYAERTWALKRASMSSLRSSMVTKPDPGPNYAKFMEEYSSCIEAGMVANIDVIKESQQDLALAAAQLESQQAVIITYPMVVSKAYKFFETFKRLFVDLILSFEHRKESQDFFLQLPMKKAYKVIEIELSLMYEILHTKAAIIYTWYGWLFRFATLICAALALYFFFNIRNKGVYKPVDVSVTYILLCGAVLLEIVAIASMLLSFWTFSALKSSASASSEKVADFLFLVIQKIRPEKESRWSNKIAQLSLIKYCINDKPSFLMETMQLLGVKEAFNNYRYTTYTPVDDELKELVFNELKNKMNGLVNADDYRRISNYRGQWTLKRNNGWYEKLSWSVDAEFDESILLWHIATDLLFLSKRASSSKCKKISQNISNYMLFLLVVRTSMLPAGIAQIRFGDTCAEAKIFLRKEGIDEQKAAAMILGVNTEYEPKHVKGDRSKSVLFNGCKLAHQLQELFPQEDLPDDAANENFKMMWELISLVWVEMLCFAASKCSGNLHARQLSMGGELLTVVWFLMVHLGIGEQYRIEAGHARAKLIVKK